MNVKNTPLFVFSILTSVFIFADVQNRESSLKFHSLNCPGEIVIPLIPQKKSYENLHAICKINYIYRGMTIAGGFLSETWKQSYSILREYSFYAKIRYLDKKKKVLMILTKPEKERVVRLDWIDGNLINTAFMENDVYTAELHFLSSSRLNEKKIFRLLREKDIDEIQIEVNKVIVDWEFKYLEEKKNHIQNRKPELVQVKKEGRFEFNVGKRIAIKVKYENNMGN